MKVRVQRAVEEMTLSLLAAGPAFGQGGGRAALGQDTAFFDSLTVSSDMALAQRSLDRGGIGYRRDCTHFSWVILANPGNKQAVYHTHVVTDPQEKDNLTD